MNEPITFYPIEREDDMKPINYAIQESDDNAGACVLFLVLAPLLLICCLTLHVVEAIARAVRRQATITPTKG